MDSSTILSAQPDGTDIPLVPAPSPQRNLDGDNSSTIHLIEGLRSHALEEVANWKCSQTSRRSVFLQQRLQKVSESTQKVLQKLNVLPAEVVEFSRELVWLAENSRLLRAALNDIRLTLTNTKKFPEIISSRGERMPRVYAIARCYLEAVDFRFSCPSLSVYVEAIQQKMALQMKELYGLRAMLQLVFLEQIAKIHEAFSTLDGNPHRSLSPDIDLAKWISGLREIGEENWEDLFEKLSPTEQILREDPAGAYPYMDFESRDRYCKLVAELAAHSDLDETEVARRAIALADSTPQPISDPRGATRRTHVGYYLVDQGRKLLEEQINYRPPLSKALENLILARPLGFYIGGILFTTLAVIILLLSGLTVPPSALVVLLLLLPAAESAVSVINQLATFLVSPRPLPRLDFSKGIPADCTTMVVVPTLLLDEKHTTQMVKDLEIRYLANRDANLHFALLTDSPDSSRPFDDKDHLVELCSQLIHNLNERYGQKGKGSFFLFHRHRIYNAAEDRWMGWERKRGKLLDLNNLLRNSSDNFPVKVGDLSVLNRVRYVITLDSDTQLPKDSASKLIGTLAHPLNLAVIDPLTNTVVEGYSILQPRVEISVRSAGWSHLASLLSGETGFDIYTRAISDLYQDLFGEGSFTGKGIYEVDSFQKVLGRRFPCNALLSHDLIEGAYARAGLVSDIELIDDYPSHFSAYSRRKHRWARGDWQIILWLSPRVPDFFGRKIPNPLTWISRWKILDNLRRSLTEIATLFLLVGGWFFLPGEPRFWTLATLVLMLTPTYFQFVLSLLRSLSTDDRVAAWKQAGATFVDRQITVFLMLALLLHQALTMIDAIVRTLVRLTVTRKRLLEWETAAESELGSRERTPVDVYLDWTPWLSLGLGLSLAVVRPEALTTAVPLLAVWSVSKLLCRWLNRPALEAQPPVPKPDEFFLRSVGLRTWRYFRQFSNAEMKWMIPDNVQETPPSVTPRLSPTNLGLLLSAKIAAYEMGYLTSTECITEIARTLSSAKQLPRYKGHFLNWYDIHTLKPLEPFFVSTVDSGNLAGCLWMLKQACLEMDRHPLLRSQLWCGIRDHLNLMAELADRDQHPAVPAETLRTLGERVDLLTHNPSCRVQAWTRTEQEITEIVSRCLSGPPEEHEELRWWAEELLKRLEATQKLMENFAPWLLPQYASFLDSYELRFQRIDENLTLESLPAFLAELDQHLEQLSGRKGTQLSVKHTIGSLRALLPICLRHTAAARENCHRLAAEAETLVEEMDFGLLYCPRRKLLSVGYDISIESQTKSCYDLLASESRMAAFIAVAKGDVPQDSWLHLGRAQTARNGKRVLLSWAGSMFEYLMPSLWMKSYPNTIFEQNLRAVVQCQQEYGESNRIPWGISEAAFSDRDHEGYYQYRAFGLPDLALKRSAPADIVVAPYATFLALPVDPRGAVSNLRSMSEMQWLDRFGFYESADYTETEIGLRRNYEVVRCWMAHHQGMSLSAICNFLTNSSLQRYFHNEPLVIANERILHEKVPKASSVEVLDEPNLSVEMAGAGLLEFSHLPAVGRASARLASQICSDPRFCLSSQRVSRINTPS
jgi:cyclic beta-1,2-glucan synthetase